MEYQFTKMQGIGNDVVVFDTFSKSLNLTREQIRHIADRQFGIGCDQVLLLEPPEGNETDVRYRIFNADGGEVAQCGNGARCVAVYLKEKDIITKANIVAETAAGQLILNIDDDASVTVNMGVPQFEPSRIPMQADKYLEQYRLNIGDDEVTFGAVRMTSSPALIRSIGDDEVTFGAVYMGNPHAVIIVDDVDITRVNVIGPAMQLSELFPESVNVSFIQILNKAAFKLRVFERGSGETLACGSGACAAMVIACQQGYLEGIIDAELRGGHLTLRWAGEGEPVFMTGFAMTVFEGKIDL